MNNKFDKQVAVTFVLFLVSSCFICPSLPLLNLFCFVFHSYCWEAYAKSALLICSCFTMNFRRYYFNLVLKTNFIIHWVSKLCTLPWLFCSRNRVDGSEEKNQPMFSTNRSKNYIEATCKVEHIIGRWPQNTGFILLSPLS